MLVSRDQSGNGGDRNSDVRGVVGGGGSDGGFPRVLLTTVLGTHGQCCVPPASFLGRTGSVRCKPD